MLQYLKQESNQTFTENGAVTYSSTLSDCLDLFATVGALRRESEEEIVSRFMRAYTENKDNKIKTIKIIGILINMIFFLFSFIDCSTKITPNNIFFIIPYNNNFFNSFVKLCLL